MDDVASAGSNPASESVQADAGSQVQTQAQLSTQGSQVQTGETEKPSASTREALEKAFARVDGAQQPKGDRERGPDGKFVARQPDAQAQQPGTAAALKAEDAAKAAAEKAAADKQGAQINPPPPGFTKAAQEAWAQVPDVVRADVERRVSELTAGLEQHKTAAEQLRAAYEPIARFDEMARQSGTTLDKALEAYVGIEDAIRANPVQGIVQICQNMGIDPRQMTAWMVQAMNGQAPQGMPVQQQQQRPAQPQPDPAVSELRQELNALKAERIVTDFANARDEAGQLKHPYFAELENDIAEMLSTKYAKDLPDAYQKAVRLNPDIAAKIEQDKAARAAKPAQPDPEQTREKANKSLTGSPSAGSNPSARKPAGSAREALQSAFAQVGLA